MAETVDLTQLLAQIKLQPRFSDTSDDAINLAITDAKLLVNELRLPTSVLMQATRLYACHLLLVESVVDEGVQSETMGPLSHTNYDWSKRNDPYLLEFNNLCDRYGRNRNRGAVWTVD